MRTLALYGASCKRRSFFYCTGAAWKSLQLLPLLMVEGCVGRSWGVWTGAMGFANELRMYGVLRSSPNKIFGYLPVCVEKSLSEVHFPAPINGLVTDTTSCSAGMPFLALPIATSPRCRELREVS
jgi:hypothetical protein